MIEPWMFHERHQHAVGQGGFHSAEVRSGEQAFWYVYDCGSSNRDALDRELETFTEEHHGRPLDLLALSHLDEDHVNGVEQLLAHREVEIVLLPYLGSDERLLLAIESTARGRITSSHWDLYADPSAWFRDRGAKTIVRVLPGGPNPPDTPGNQDGAPPIPQEPFLFEPGREPTPTETVEFPELAAGDRVVSSGESIPLRAGGGGRLSSYWEFVPFCHPDLEKTPKFISAVKKLSGLKGKMGRTLVLALKKHLSDKKKRVALKETYANMWADHNLSSMSLYSGPVFDGPRVEVDVAYGQRELRGVTFDRYPVRRGGVDASKVGWLGTGDAKLVAQVRASRFADHYRRQLVRTGTFVVPHHGSRHNFRGHLFRDTLDPYIWCASAGRNSYGHPDSTLRRALSHRGAFVRVSQNEGRELSEYYRWFR